MESKPSSSQKSHSKSLRPKGKTNMNNHTPRKIGIPWFINVPEPFRTILFVCGTMLFLSGSIYWANSATKSSVASNQSVETQPSVPVTRNITLTDYRGEPVLTFATSSSVNPFAQQSIPISYSYYDTGYRRTMTDASGTTLYTYDVRDRLLTKQTSQGTLTYTYDAEGNVRSVRSSNTNGVSLDYGYDALNRLETIKDNNLPTGQNTTTYTYDDVSNLATITQPNGVKAGFSYDGLNRIKTVTYASGTTTLARYSYTLGNTGNRLSATELDGRTVTYTYDELYRLKTETISGAVSPSPNGTVSYTHDAASNRLSQTSTLAAIPSASYTYNDNDWLTTDSYDSNGNTLVSGGKGFIYDFQDKLIGMAGGPSLVSIVYDGDGNRVRKTVGDTITSYLIDDNTPTRFPQVAEEIQSGVVVKRYTYGFFLVSQSQYAEGIWKTVFYGIDAHSGVRFLTDPAGSISDRYDYDAFGQLLHSSGQNSNNYLFAGEQYDPDLSLYYLRARYYAPQTGRFWTMDKHEGNPFNPLTLHKYVYAQNDPINNSDPSGNDTLIGLYIVQFYRQTIAAGSAVGAVLVPRASQIAILTQGAFRFLITRGQGAVNALLRGTTTRGVSALQDTFRRTVRSNEVITEAESAAATSFQNFVAFKDFINNALNRGFGNVNPSNIEWHHLVEQGGRNATRFVPQSLHSVANVVPTPVHIHSQISAFYTRGHAWLPAGYNSLRQYMQTLPFEQQWRYGVEIWNAAMQANGGPPVWRLP